MTLIKIDDRMIKKGSDIMVSEARKKANEKYNAKTYAQIMLRVRKEEKEKIQEYAESKGLSLNGYINKLIQEDMSKEE